MSSTRCWRHLISVPPALRIRCYSQNASSAPQLDLSRPVQSYISTSDDPYLNLSIEHYFLQKCSPEAATLFLYTNRPSIIIGRNQNPWTEVNLNILNHPPTTSTSSFSQPNGPESLANVSLVRRRSGGGTVFHDPGNVNWTVISPSSTFTRDKHAAMVVRALRALGVERARVNERHDIVLDQGGLSSSSSSSSSADGDGVSQGARARAREFDEFRTPWTQLAQGQMDPRPLKVSGSAYKLTRQRALHHGTALLGSPHLDVIPRYLRSPAKGFIRGRGVESVSSPVGNVGVGNGEFVARVQGEFGAVYGGVSEGAVEVGVEMLGLEEVRRGYDELRSAEWTFLQTPQFTFSNKVPEDSPLAATLTEEPPVTISLTVKNGAIAESDLAIKGTAGTAATAALAQALEKRNVHEIRDWPAVFRDAGVASSEAMEVAKWMQGLLVTPAERE